MCRDARGRDGIGPGEAAAKGTRQLEAAILYRMWGELVRGTPAEGEAVAATALSGMQACNPPVGLQTCIPATHDQGTRRGESSQPIQRTLLRNCESFRGLNCCPGPMCGMEGLLTISVTLYSRREHIRDRTWGTIAWNDSNRLCCFAQYRKMKIHLSKTRRPNS